MTERARECLRHDVPLADCPECCAEQEATPACRLWCAGCGARWSSPEGFIVAGVVHLCGDCWRKVQPALHTVAASRVGGTPPPADFPRDPPRRWQEIAVALQGAANTLVAQEFARKSGCINCGDSSRGGYATEEVGPFCSDCWDELQRALEQPAASRVGGTPPESDRQASQHAYTESLQVIENQQRDAKLLTKASVLSVGGTPPPADLLTAQRATAFDLVYHAQRLHVLVARKDYVECSCGATFWFPDGSRSPDGDGQSLVDPLYRAASGKEQADGN